MRLLKFPAIVLFSFLTLRCYVFAAGPNMLDQNTGFEVGLGGWAVESVRLMGDWGNYGDWGPDNTTAAEGRNSLRISNPNKKYVFRLASKTVQCEPGVKYTVSFYAKADRTGIILSSRFGPLFRAVASGGAKLTTEWQRYAYTGEVPADPEKYQKGIYDTWIQASSDLPVPYTIWLDAVQFEKGELSPYAPQKPVEAGFASNKFCHVYESGKPDEVALNIYSAQPDFQGKAILELEDYYHGKTLKTETLNLNLKDKNHFTRTVKIPPLPRGSYKYRAKVIDEKGREISRRDFLFATIVKSRNTGDDPNSFFGTHVNLYFSGLWSGMIVDAGTMSFVGDDPEKYYRLARDIGIKWLRIFKVFNQEIIEPQPGEFHFAATDRVVELARRHNLGILGVVGQGYGYPKWARQERPANKGSFYQADIPKPGAILKYTEELARHYKGRVDNWETWNEPLCGMTWEEYVPIGRETYQGIKKGNPDAVVWGLCVTQEIEDNKIIEAGGLKDLDAISLHAPIEWIRNTVRKYHNDQDLRYWQTEAGVGTWSAYPDVQRVFGASSLGYMLDAVEGAERALYDEVAMMTEGAEKHFYFGLHHGRSYPIYLDNAFVEYDDAAKPILPVFNALIETLAGTKLVKRIKMKDDVLCVVFEKDDRPLIYLQSKKSLPIPVTVGLAVDSVKALDAMGNPVKLKWEKENLTFTITEKPLYLFAEKSKTGEVVKVFSNLPLARLKPFTVKSIRLRPDGATPAMVVEIINETDDLLNGQVSVRELPSGWEMKAEAVNFGPVPARTTKENTVEVWFPFQNFQSAEELNPVQVNIIAGETDLTLKSRPLRILRAGTAQKSLTLSDDRKNWNKAVPLRLNTAKQIQWGDKELWSGTTDLSAEVYAQWNKDNLYLLTVVHDNLVVQPRGKDLYLSDAVEFVFNPYLDKKSDNPLLTQIVFAPRPDLDWKVLAEKNPGGGGKFVQLDSVQSRAGKTDDGYLIHLAIPWSNFPGIKPVPGLMLGFDFAVDDSDRKEADRKYQMVWSGDGQFYCQPDKHGVLLLE